MGAEQVRNKITVDKKWAFKLSLHENHATAPQSGGNFYCTNPYINRL